MGCVSDDPRAWVAPSRVVVTPSGLEHPADLYTGAGSKQHGLKASAWSRFLVKGPGLNRVASMELYEARLREDTSALNVLGLSEGLLSIVSPRSVAMVTS